MSGSGEDTSRKRSLSPQPEGNDHAGRQRSKAACAPCRQRKRKCDGRMPCGTCVRYEYKCEYSAPRKSFIVHGDGPPEMSAPAPVGSSTLPSVIQLQKHPLTAPGARFHHRGIMDPVKTRFVRANSAIAFPRILGMEMESEAIPRMHSFAWHTGRRPEPVEQPVNISSLATWPDLHRLAKTYFKVVKPEIGLLDESDFMEQASSRYTNPDGYSEFDAVILGVVALGSFFSHDPHPREYDFMIGARDVLNHRLMNQSSINIVAGWILRTIWLRLASRPHGSWLSSSITMHHAEACGLHKEMQTIAVVYPAAPAGDYKLSKTRRRLFWIGRALNVILSFEYGRSRINFEIVTTKKPASESGSHAHQFIELADLLPSDIVDRELEPDPPGTLGRALTKIEEMQTESSFITLLKADLAFAIYRRLWLMSLTDAKDRAESVINVGKQALQASAKLLDENIPWWNVLHGPFQFLCVVLAVGTPKSFSHISEIMKLLHRVATTYDNHITREAYNQATALVNMTRKRKEKELDALSSLPELLPFGDHPSVGSSGMTEVPNLDWPLDLPFEWDVFLNPDLIVSQQQAQSAMDGSYGDQLGFQM